MLKLVCQYNSKVGLGLTHLSDGKKTSEYNFFSNFSGEDLKIENLPLSSCFIVNIISKYKLFARKTCMGCSLLHVIDLHNFKNKYNHNN